MTCSWLEEALKYVKMGYSIIPIASNSKKPAEPWKHFQKRMATPGEIETWSKKWPNGNIGIVTGEISNLTVIDVDTEEAWEWYNSKFSTKYNTVVKTPSGLHVYCQYNEELRNRANIYPGIDIRSEGGYVVAPPSIINDKKYEVLRKEKGDKIPEGFLKRAPKGVAPVVENNNLILSEPGRDNTLYHVALRLARGGMIREEADGVIRTLAAACTPPFPEPEALRKVESAYQSRADMIGSTEKAVLEWISLAHGSFQVGLVYKDLGLRDTEQQKICRMYLEKLVKDRKIERYGTKYGSYRIRMSRLQKMNWKKADIKDIDFRLPFGLHRLINILPKNIFLIAGMQNAGKTSLLLKMVEENQIDHIIHYFSSEMGPAELKLRLKKWKHMEEDDWIFNAYERNECWEDVIFPNDVNIIDFLEITNDFWKVAWTLNQIHERLDKGLAIVAIQKGTGDMGRGGTFGLEKPRLYLNLDIIDPGTRRLTIRKAKNVRSGVQNPDGKYIDFAIENGCELIPKSAWFDDQCPQAKQGDLFGWGSKN